VIGIEATRSLRAPRRPRSPIRWYQWGMSIGRCINSIRAESAPSYSPTTAKGHRWEGLEGRTYEVVRMVAGYKPLIVFASQTR